MIKRTRACLQLCVWINLILLTNPLICNYHLDLGCTHPDMGISSHDFNLWPFGIGPFWVDKKRDASFIIPSGTWKFHTLIILHPEEGRIFAPFIFLGKGKCSHPLYFPPGYFHTPYIFLPLILLRMGKCSHFLWFPGIFSCPLNFRQKFHTH